MANREELIRFTVWAMQCRDEGLHITPAQVAAHFDSTRATAYRWCADYFAARGWQWPREKPKSQHPATLAWHRWKARRYSAFNHPNPQRRSSGSKSINTTSAQGATS